MEFSRKKLNVGDDVFWVLKEKESRFTLTARRDGIAIGGSDLKLESMDDLQEFAKVMSETWKKHLSLVPKIVNKEGDPL